MRTIVKSWKNKWSGGFTKRIRWYAAGGEEGEIDIRLCLEDTEIGTHNLYPKTLEEANCIWHDFKNNLIDIYGNEKT